MNIFFCCCLLTHKIIKLLISLVVKNIYMGMTTMRKRKVNRCNVIVTAYKTLLKLKFVQKVIFSFGESCTSVAAHLFLYFSEYVLYVRETCTTCDDHFSLSHNLILLLLSSSYLRYFDIPLEDTCVV